MSKFYFFYTGAKDILCLFPIGRTACTMAVDYSSRGVLVELGGGGGGGILSKIGSTDVGHPFFSRLDNIFPKHK